MQYIIRKGSFDSGHRVMNEKMKCFNIHGHTYLFELKFGFERSQQIGYAIDFKEIKRVGCQWIDDVLDHGFLMNPHDAAIYPSIEATGSKYWKMSLNGVGNYCNPTVENIAKEIFLAMKVLFQPYKELSIHQVTLWETPNCCTECFSDSISDFEECNFYNARYDELAKYAKEKGMIEYDDRKDGKATI